MWTLGEIAQHVNGEVVGDTSWQVDSVATLKKATQQQVTFLANSRYTKYLSSTKAGVVLVSRQLDVAVVGNAIIVDDPYIAYAMVATLLNPEPETDAKIESTAVISSEATISPNARIAHHVVISDDVFIGHNASIGAGTVIEQGVRIGNNARISPNVTICSDVTIGDNVIIHPGVVIGADGFGIANDKGKWIKVPQLGSVKIGDDVEIGANTTIDCGALENTIIGNGVKLDNQIQIAHNDVIGDNTVIAGCTGIAGSTEIGRNCIIGGGVGINGHLKITDGVIITGMSMVTKSITKPGSYSSGIPAEASNQWHKNVIRYRQIEKLIERVKKLESHIIPKS
ncbi:MAG: UDP-3-O-[3-hydroxymyristoyl] glucosamine N-acyltransferase [Methylophagaceae bacterium]|jgi:UDP-3-O-[3-hydroxymyristoyl] glucosamine N-acyltransferase